jgi:adenylosuccinate synthase
MKFHAVVGANYGDEGKGLTTDWLCRLVRPIRVVRFNGGAQAGHTVCTEGDRHVFSSYGSGTLAGVPTELTRDVIINPYAALMEHERLVRLVPERRPPRIFFTQQSPITTQFEVAINQAIEERRGDARHGSCGLGINETVERHLAMQKEDMRLVTCLYGDDSERVKDVFNWLRWEWTPRRMKQLGFDATAIHSLQMRSIGYEDAFVECLRAAYKTSLVEADEVYGNVLYEGAQGLGLDEELGEFPYVTRSNTGIRNVLRDIKRRLDALDANDLPHTLTVLYPCRTYLTRHGRGPLANEDQSVNVLCGNTHLDETNFTNPWQEHLRYAPLHVADTCSRIKKDYARNAAFLKTELPLLNVRLGIVLTCCDQSNAVRLVDNDLKPTFVADIVERFSAQGLPVVAASYGPSSETMVTVDYDFIQGLTGGTT